ncbi:hypothetical protein EQZ20_20970 [Bacillus glycinifermentans]|uniref:Uncharacterized protein n=1 Tax=Bacillus glycinifermentans TaxID=1664069 RepID=A0AAJ4D4P2_9BACI|nr:hypothetical protein [Bacillus glycinifermentans]QAT67106.1 hypothetical protein EQZ20_20970 [Bacillus glycinifermentans]
MNVNNKMRVGISNDSRGVSKVVDESLDGTKAIPVVFVQKTADGSFSYGSEPVEGTHLDNEMNHPIETDPSGTAEIVDEDVNGVKAVPIVLVTKNAEGEFVYTSLDSGNSGVEWSAILNKPPSFPPSSHTHPISQITNLQTTLNSKLTASQAAAQADSTATDIEGLVADFNALLAKLRTAKIMTQ